IPSEAAGKQVRCKTCNTVFEAVPEVAPSGPPPLPLPADAVGVPGKMPTATAARPRPAAQRGGREAAANSAQRPGRGLGSPVVLLRLIAVRLVLGALTMVGGAAPFSSSRPPARPPKQRAPNAAAQRGGAPLKPQPIPRDDEPLPKPVPGPKLEKILPV